MKARCSCYTNYAGHVRINKQGQERPRQSKGHWNFTKSIKNLNQIIGKLRIEWQVSRNFAKCKRQFCEKYFAKIECEKRRKWSRPILTHFGPKLVLK